MKRRNKEMASIELLLFISISMLSPSKIDCQRIEFIRKLVPDIVGEEPTNLWGKICWSKKDEIDFVMSVSYPIQVVNNDSIHLPDDGNTNTQWFLIDMLCESSSNFLSKVDEKYFAHPYRWLIIDANVEIIQNLQLLPDSNVIISNLKQNQYILKQGSSFNISFTN